MDVGLAWHFGEILQEMKCIEATVVACHLLLSLPDCVACYELQGDVATQTDHSVTAISACVLCNLNIMSEYSKGIITLTLTLYC